MTAAPEAAPHLRRKLNPQKTHSPLWPKLPPAEDSVPPAPAEKPAGNSIDAKLDAILNAVTTLVKALSQKAQEPVQPPADADPGKDDGVDGLLAGITKAHRTAQHRLPTVPAAPATKQSVKNRRPRMTHSTRTSIRRLDRMALSQLNPQIIGAEMEHGFAGSYARQPDMIVVTRPVGEKEPLPFGMALMYDANGAVVLMQGSGVTADRFAGVAGREMRSALSYTDQNTGAYTTGNAGSVFQRGSINVLCQKGTPKRGGAVYVRIIKNTSLPNAVVGGFEAEADSTSANTVKLTGCQWGGSADANGVAELVILTRQNV